ncbi:MAG TPA: CocE/NonD family hydrolase, partial [Gemmatimonadales bacterium]
TYSLFRRAVERGYAVVAQDARGRYTSDGEFLPYQQEGKDGHDTIEWAAAQSWSTGDVGTIGLSYPGAVQWLAAVEQPPHLKAMVPAMTFASPFHFWYTGGVWDQSWVSWIWHNIAPDLRSRLARAPRSRQKPGPLTAEEARNAWAAQGRPLQEVRPLLAMDAFRGLAEWYYEWIRHPPGDDWWDWADLTDKYDRVSAAVLNLSGWHDEAYGPAGATTNFAGLAKARQGSTDGVRGGAALVVGPWTHGIGPIGRTRSGEREMGPKAVLDYDELVLRWMDRWVRGVKNGVDREKPVRVYVMGADRWLEADAWPIPRTTPQSFYLVGGSGNAKDGSLSTQPPRQGRVTTSFVSDPASPVRDLYAESPGAHDYRALAVRQDVLVFDSEPLTRDLLVAGPIEAEIHLSTDAKDTDLWVRLLDVAPDGTAWNLMSPGLEVIRASYRNGGPARELLEPGRIYPLRLANLVTANLFQRGHRVRVQISTAFAPHMSRNLHTGELEAESSDGVPAKITIHHDPERPSRIVLPVVR